MPGGLCQTACQKIKALNCGDITSCDACTSNGGCAAEADAYFGCLASKATLSCDTQAMATQVSGCDVETRSYGLCSLCTVSASDDTCGTCTKGACCTELKAYGGASDASGFDSCVKPCTTQACVDQCATMYPNAGAAYKSAVACQTKGCATNCFCSADAADPACVTCLKTNCCDLYAAYASASDASVFSGCVDGTGSAGGAACTDQACVDACAAASPVAGAAYDALVNNCAATKCVDDCGG